MKLQCIVSFSVCSVKWKQFYLKSFFLLFLYVCWNWKRKKLMFSTLLNWRNVKLKFKNEKVRFHFWPKKRGWIDHRWMDDFYCLQFEIFWLDHLAALILLEALFRFSDFLLSRLTSRRPLLSLLVALHLHQHHCLFVYSLWLDPVKAVILILIIWSDLILRLHESGYSCKCSSVDWIF